nr:unnamed protein product [Digitaria exilis]
MASSPPAPSPPPPVGTSPRRRTATASTNPPNWQTSRPPAAAVAVVMRICAPLGNSTNHSTPCRHYPGHLDEQFCQVEDLQDEASPNFAEEVVTLFFKDSARLISNIEQALEKYPNDFNKWDAYMQQLKGSCSSCMNSFKKVKREHGVLRQKLEAYFQRSCYDKLVLLELLPGLVCKNGALACYKLQQNGVWRKKIYWTQISSCHNKLTLLLKSRGEINERSGPGDDDAGGDGGRRRRTDGARCPLPDVRATNISATNPTGTHRATRAATFV